MAKLNDKSRKQMIADRANGMTYSQLAEKYHVSKTTAERVLKSDPETGKKVAQKKEQNTADILAYMDSQTDKVCRIINLGLDSLLDPEKFAEASPPQITTALGTLIDKWTRRAEVKEQTLERADDPLTVSLKEAARYATEQKTNGNPEISALSAVQSPDL